MEWKKLSQLVERKICYGIVQPGKGKNGNIPVIKVNNIISGLKSITELDTTTHEIASKFQRTQLFGGEIVVSVVGSVGNTAIVPSSFKGCNLVRATAMVDIKDKVLATYVMYYFKTHEAQKYIESRLNTTVQATLNIKDLEEMPIPILQSSIILRLVSILSALDAKIENNNKINANLEAQAQALFKSWFVDFTPFKDQPFVDSELGPIPQGWKVGKLGDIALQSTEKVLTRNDVKVLSPITTGKLVLSEEYFTKQVFSKSIRNYKIVKQGAFAYNPARVNIGSLGMNEFKFDGCVSPVYVVFECLKGYSFFFDLFRKTEFFKQAVISFAIGGVRQTLNYSDFALIDVTIPPLNIVQSFNEIYLHLKKKISINEEENQRLAALRDTLLPKLMSGEIKL